MKGLFKYDNPIFSTLVTILNMIVLSVLWLICCVPIFTAGASTTALYYSVQKWLKHERGYAWSCFFDSFKANFKQATAGGLILTALVLLVFTDFWITRFFQMESIAGGALKPVFIFFLIVLAVYGFWYFAYLARFENTFKEHMKIAFVLMLRHFPTSLAIAALEVGAFALLYVAPYFVAIVPVLSVWLMGLLTERVFRKYMTDEDKALEDERNNRFGDRRR